MKDQLFKTHYTELAHAASVISFRNYTLSIPEREDFKQDILFKCFEYIEKYNSEKMKLFTFVFTIAKGISIDYARKRKAIKREGLNISFDVENDEGFNLHDLVGRNDQTFFDYEYFQNKIDKVVNDKPNSFDKAVYELFFIQGMKMNEISDQLVLNENTIKTIIRRIRMRLQVELKEFITI